MQDSTNAKERGRLVGFMTVENGAIGHGGQQQGLNAGSIKQRLVQLVGELEASQTHWKGGSGSAFNNAKNILFAKFDEIHSSTGAIATGLGQSQTHVNTADETSMGDVSASSGAVSGINGRINVNV